MNVFKMAWRNVWRNTRRSVVTIGAITLALWVMLLYSGLIVGYLTSMEDDILNMEVGDVQIFAPTYRDSPSLFRVIPNTDDLVERILAQGYRVSPRLLGGGLAASGEFSAGVSLRGVDPKRDATVTLIQQHVAKGHWLDPVDPTGVVLGKKLARTLNATVGAELVVLSQAADGSMANDLYTIRGVLKSVADSVDRTGVIMLDTSFRELMVLPRGAHQMIVRRPQGEDLPTAVRTLRTLAPSLDVQSWRQLMPTLATMLDASRAMMVIIFSIIYLAVGILLLNAMLMAVFERIREFGVLKAVGAGPITVFALIFIEAMIQLSIAMVIGTLLGLPCMVYLSEVGINVGQLGGMSMMGLAMRSVWHGHYTLEIVAPAYGVLITIVTLSVLYPAFKAAWIKPVESMRHQ